MYYEIRIYTYAREHVSALSVTPIMFLASSYVCVGMW